MLQSDDYGFEDRMSLPRDRTFSVARVQTWRQGVAVAGPLFPVARVQTWRQDVAASGPSSRRTTSLPSHSNTLSLMPRYNTTCASLNRDDENATASPRFPDPSERRCTTAANCLSLPVPSTQRDRLYHQPVACLCRVAGAEVGRRRGACAGES